MTDEPRKRLICTSNHAHWRTCYGTDPAGQIVHYDADGNWWVGGTYTPPQSPEETP